MPAGSSNSWFQFRLRTLLIAVAVLAAPCAWIASERSAIARRRDAFAELGVGMGFLDDQPAWREWLLGDDAVAYCRCMSVPGKTVDDERLAFFRGLARLEILTLKSARITDAGLANLQGLTNLRRLSLRNAPITDAGIIHFHGLPRLEALDLSGTQITDAGLLQLRGLSGLQEVYLRETQVTPAGIAQLQTALPNCKIDSSVPAEVLAAQSNK